MEMRGAALSDGLQSDRPLGVFGAIGGVQERHFGRLVHVDIGDLSSLVARIQEIGAVHSHGHRAVGLRPASGVLADGTGVGLRGQTAPRGLAEAAIHRHAGHDLDQLGRVPALDRQMGHQVRVQGLPGLAGVQGGDGFGVGFDLHVLGCARDLQGDVRQRSALALIEDDVLPLPGGEAGHGNGQGVGPGLDGGDIEEAAAVRRRIADGSGVFVLQHHFGIGNHSSGRVPHRGCQRSAGVLRERGGGSEYQGRDQQAQEHKCVV